MISNSEMGWGELWLISASVDNFRSCFLKEHRKKGGGGEFGLSVEEETEFNLGYVT